MCVSYVVFIIDTTLPFWTVKCSAYVLLALGGIGVRAVAVALSNLALLVVQEEFRLIVTGSLSALLLGFLLRVVYGRCPLVTLPHDRPSIFSRRNVYGLLLRHRVFTPIFRFSEVMIQRILRE
jgi:CBS domain containing-hemolysin-like protein